MDFLIIESDNVSITLLNNTTNDYYILPYLDGSYNQNYIYKEIKVWKQNPSSILKKIEVKLELNCVDLSTTVLTWVKNKNNISAIVVFDPDDTADTDTITKCKLTALSREIGKKDDIISCKLSIEGVISLST